MIEVFEKKHVPENCSTRLHGREFGCAHADMKSRWLAHRIIGIGCSHYWLDQHRFERV